MTEGSYFLDFLAADQNRLILADRAGAVKQRSALDGQPLFLRRREESQCGEEQEN